MVGCRGRLPWSCPTYCPRTRCSVSRGKGYKYDGTYKTTGEDVGKGACEDMGEGPQARSGQGRGRCSAPSSCHMLGSLCYVRTLMQREDLGDNGAGGGV